MKTLLLTVGTLALLVGLLWIGQGTGYVNWPQSSFIDQPDAMGLLRRCTGHRWIADDCHRATPLGGGISI
ncbi:MAG: hypothetical protein ACJAVZ_002153 [Afipia broomeae]|jgi:hypothetical protein